MSVSVGAEPARGMAWLRVELQLAAALAAPGRARTWTRAVLAEWDLAQFAEDAELVVSELVTNAVQAALPAPRPARVILSLMSGRAGLLVQVYDECPGLPARHHPGVSDETGRGLLIVDRVAAQTGCYRPPGTPGKVTWCLLAGMDGHS